MSPSGKKNPGEQCGNSVPRIMAPLRYVVWAEGLLMYLHWRLLRATTFTVSRDLCPDFKLSLDTSVEASLLSL